MKFFISLDLEGITGVTSWRSMVSGRLQEEVYRYARREIAAVLEGLFNGAAIDEVTICDSHALGENLEMEGLPSHVDLIRGFPRTYYMMEGFSSDYDGVIFLGYHAPAGESMAPMDHSYSSSTFYNVFINDKRVGETEINALLAGYYDVPVLMISGDNRLADFSGPSFSKLGTRMVSTKEGLGHSTARMYPLDKVLADLKKAAEDASKELSTIKPYKEKAPYHLRLELTDTLRTDLISVIPGFKRKAGRIVEFSSGNYRKIYRALMAAVYMGIAAKNIK